MNKIFNEFTFCKTHRRISYIRSTLTIDATNDVKRNANVLQTPTGNKNMLETMYKPGNVVIFGSHWNELIENNN